MKIPKLFYLKILKKHLYGPGVGTRKKRIQKDLNPPFGLVEHTRLELVTS